MVILLFAAKLFYRKTAKRKLFHLMAFTQSDYVLTVLFPQRGRVDPAPSADVSSPAGELFVLIRRI